MAYQDGDYVWWLLMGVAALLFLIALVQGCAAPPEGCGPWIGDPAEAGYVEVSPGSWVCPELVD